MAFLVFGTSVVFAVDKHICEGEVWSVSYYGKAEVCEKMQSNDDVEEMSCCSLKIIDEQLLPYHSQLKKKPCCSKETYVNQSLDNQDQDSTFDVNVPISGVLTAHALCPSFEEVAEAKEFYHLCPPPDIDCDYQSLFQVYLI